MERRGSPTRSVATVAELEDPSLVDGYVELVQREILMKVVDQVESNEGEFEDYVMLRVFRRADLTLKIELTSETNVFFVYYCELSQKGFKEFIDDEGLALTVQQFPHWLDKLMRQQSTSFTYRVMASRGQLTIRQQLQFKAVRLARLHFQYVSEQRVKESLMYRYSLMLQKKHQLNDVLVKANNLIKVKNPSLLLNFHKIKKTQAFR